MRLSELLDKDWSRLLEFSGIQYRPRRMRDGFSPRFGCVVLVRIAHALNANGWRRSAKLVSLSNFLAFGIEVPARLAIGPGLVIPHTHGTVIGASHIGANVTIYQQVTLGAKLADFAFDPTKRPHVEDGVTITAGAKILGPVRLGAGCTIGANAVVLHDVPARAIAVGVPARVIERGGCAAQKEG
jgi:serine O-acetyltransferase